MCIGPLRKLKRGQCNGATGKRKIKNWRKCICRDGLIFRWVRLQICPFRRRT